MRNSILCVIAVAALSLGACDGQQDQGRDGFDSDPDSAASGFSAPGTSVPGAEPEEPVGPGAQGVAGPATGQDPAPPVDSLRP